MYIGNVTKKFIHKIVLTSRYLFINIKENILKGVEIFFNFIGKIVLYSTEKKTQSKFK